MIVRGLKIKSRHESETSGKLQDKERLCSVRCRRDARTTKGRLWGVIGSTCEAAPDFSLFAGVAFRRSQTGAGLQPGTHDVAGYLRELTLWGKLKPMTDTSGIKPSAEVTLAPLTTLEIGGPADWLVEATNVAEVRDALRWAADCEVPVTVLGGGSNVVVADAGVRGLVLRIAGRGIDLERRHDRTVLTAAAGEPWDDVVKAAVGEDLAGIECLSGVPGTTGATPIQNVGAYGQEVGAVIEGVRVLHRETLEEGVLTAEECEFGYRSSVLRRADNPYVVLDVSFALRPGGSPELTYSQVAERFPGTTEPSLEELRGAVLDLRRAKSMVLDDDDPNRRSAGSFFVNPVVDEATLNDLIASARLLGVLSDGDRPPAHEVGEGLFKLSAGWLIEHAGFPRGCVRGRVGLSSRHALALINRGGASTEELVVFATEIRRGVRSHLGIDLRPEPVFLGFDKQDPTE